MFDRHAAKSLALVTLLASGAPSLAMTGAGCPDLPEHDRAVGTIENGAYSCGMSMEEAKRILARDQRGEAAQPVAPAPHRRHHRRVVQQPE